MNNRTCLKYKDALLNILNTISGDAVFTVHDIDMSNTTLTALHRAGFLVRVGRKRMGKQWCLTYKISISQRFYIIEMLGKLENERRRAS